MATLIERPDMLTDFADFLASRPTPLEIWKWHPSARVQKRLLRLIDKKKEDALSPNEAQELERSLEHEIFLRLIKARVNLKAMRRG